MDNAAADLKLLIGVGEVAGEGSVASREGSEAAAEQAAGEGDADRSREGRPARELRTTAGKGGRRGSFGPRRGRAVGLGASDCGGEGRRRRGRRRSPTEGRSDGGEA